VSKDEGREEVANAGEVAGNERDAVRVHDGYCASPSGALGRGGDTEKIIVIEVVRWSDVGREDIQEPAFERNGAHDCVRHFIFLVEDTECLFERGRVFDLYLRQRSEEVKRGETGSKALYYMTTCTEALTRLQTSLV
jgi:hypothetical protein